MCPFDIQVEKAPEYLQLELIDLQSSTELKHLFQRSEKLKFYNEYIHEDKFPILKQMAMRIAAAIGTTYLCKSFFSKLKIVKSKNRNKLTDENMTSQLRYAVSKLPVDIRKMSNNIQKQASH